MNAAAHQWTAASIAGLVLHADERTRGQVTAWPVAGAGLAAVATDLPDILEPALNPHHRQFFHSLAFAGLLIAGGKALYDWQPETDEGRFWRKAGLIGLGAYLCHLALDTTTPRSLPLLGEMTVATRRTPVFDDDRPGGLALGWEIFSFSRSNDNG